MFLFHYYMAVLFKNKIEHTLKKWEKEISLSNELKIIFSIYLDWVVDHGHFKNELVTDLVKNNFPNSDNPDKIRPWIYFNLQKIIDALFDNKRLSINYQYLFDQLVKTNFFLDKDGNRREWCSYRKNYQIAIYVESEKLNQITIIQMQKFLEKIKYYPICFIIIKSTLTFFDIRDIKHASCPKKTMTIFHDDNEKTIEIDNELASIPCLIFGGKKLKLSDKNKFFHFPSYSQVCEKIIELTNDIEILNPLNSLKEELVDEEYCRLQ